LLNMLLFAWKLRAIPFSELPKPDAVVVSSPSPFAVKPGYQLARKFKARFVFEVRDIWPLTLQELSGMSPRHPLMAWMQRCENFAYAHADKVISVLPGAKEHMKAHGLPAGVFVCIPNGIDLDEAEKSQPLSETVEQQIPRHKFIVGYAGGIGIANAMENLIDAARILSGDTAVHFVIVGDGVERERLRERAKDLSNVTFIGSIPKLQVLELLRRFDVCYLGWHDEPLYRFGISANKTFDYMYAAKPIVHAVNAYNDTVSDAGCGISVPPENPEAVANAVLQLQRMTEDERRAMGEKGKAFAIRHHSYHNLAEAFARACFNQ